MMSLDDARALDAADPLRNLRDQFLLPDGVIYLDGNSLGPLPRATLAANRDLVDRQWGERLIRSWSEGWMDSPTRIGAKIAPLIGARADEVIVADSVSVNLFKLLTAAVQHDPARRTIVTEAGNFPTDLHIADGVARTVAGAKVKAVAREAIADAIDDQTAIVLLTHVHYKTAERFDMPAWTARVQAAGALMCWDLSHSTGAIPVDLGQADLAVGCGYKFLNGGPGAPAFLFVARRHQDLLANPLSGWMGHAAPFGFEDDYRPGAGMERWRVGTPAMLAMRALESGVDLFAQVDLAMVAQTNARLFDILAAAGDRAGLECVTPRDPAKRGSHIAFRHPRAGELIDRLIARGVIGDFRTPNIARFGLTPLYLSHTDVWRAGELLVETVAELSATA